MAYSNLSQKAKNYSRQKCREWHARNKDKIKAYQIANKEILSNLRKAYKDNLRMAALMHYSNGSLKCVHCDESRYEFLCLDHINNDGRKHREEGYGRTIYQYCKAQNYPPIFQVLCYNCNYLKIPKSELVDNVDAVRVRNRIYRIKKEVLSHYSNNELKCATCGHDDYRVLTIDHINGGGRQQRRDLGIGGGFKLYVYLFKHKFPPGYRVLCFNCNSSRLYEKP